MASSCVRLFISFADDDEEYQRELLVHLHPLAPLIEVWHEGQIEPGVDRKTAVEEALAKADIIVLLLSPDFLASDFCVDTMMAKGLERWRAKEARMVPILLRECSWRDTPIGQLHVLCADQPIAANEQRAERDAEWTRIVKHLHALASKAHSSAPSVPPPPPSEPPIDEPVPLSAPHAVEVPASALVEQARPSRPGSEAPPGTSRGARLARRLVPPLAAVMAVLLVALGSWRAWLHWHPPLLERDDGAPWDEGNLERLNSLVSELGRTSPTYVREAPAVAVFDFDNTVILNDSGDLVVWWMLQNNGYFAPVDWGETSPYLTQEAIEELNRACPRAQKPRTRLITRDNPECQRVIWNYYAKVDDPATQAFPFGVASDSCPWNPEWVNPRYAWGAQLLAGYTPDDVRSFARQALKHGLNKRGAMPVGSQRPQLGVKYYTQMKLLIATMMDHGFDVWVVSATPQPIVEVFAEQVGIPAARVIGVRSQLDEEGRLQRTLQGCGGKSAIMPYRRGKRCWVNQEIFGVRDPSALERLARRPVFAAGDSLTDLELLQDATKLRLVINRRMPELMCPALANHDGKWMINRTFDDAGFRPKKGAYRCKEACEDGCGRRGPCVDEAGIAITRDLCEPEEWKESEALSPAPGARTGCPGAPMPPTGQ